ncbi:unnamed protein product [Clonostachys rhizophaga]|uniref:Uncharacterized protein n=1 Tax=Clonostachys rhizophaga TaxID=160324 RepID=A0A9N9VCX8_9HYPO|nr:unnamed protein product [Clonostachys rhizophaga]
MKVNAASIALACFAGNVIAAPTVGSSAIQNVQSVHVPSVPAVNAGSLSKRNEDLVAQLKEALQATSVVSRDTPLADPAGLTNILSNLLNKILDVLSKVLGECAGNTSLNLREVSEISDLRQILNNLEIVKRDVSDLTDTSVAPGLDLQQIVQRVINILKALLGSCNSAGTSAATNELSGLTGQLQSIPNISLGPNPLLNIHPDALNSLTGVIGKIGTPRNPLGQGAAPDLLGLDGIVSGLGLGSLGLLGGSSAAPLGNTLGSLTGGSALTNRLGGGSLGSILSLGLGGPLGGLGGGLLGGLVNPLGFLTFLKRDMETGEIAAGEAPTLVDALHSVFGYAGSGGPIGNLVDKLIAFLGFGVKQDIEARSSATDSLIPTEELVENGSLSAVGLLAVLVELAQNGDISQFDAMDKPATQ